MDRTSGILERITGERVALLRAPGGTAENFDAFYYFYLTIAGYKLHDWNVDSGDSRRKGVPASEIVANVKKAPLKHEMNVLLHDGAGHEETVKALPEIIEYFLERGYRFAALSEEVKPVVFQTKKSKWTRRTDEKEHARLLALVHPELAAAAAGGVAVASAAAAGGTLSSAAEAVTAAAQPQAHQAAPAGAGVHPDAKPQTAAKAQTDAKDPADAKPQTAAAAQTDAKEPAEAKPQTAAAAQTDAKKPAEAKPQTAGAAGPAPKTVLLRDWAKRAGATVAWDQARDTATLSLGGVTMEWNVREGSGWVADDGGNRTPLEFALTMRGNRLYAPAGALDALFAAEAKPRAAAR